MAKAIELVLKTDEKGELHIPRDLLGNTAPGTQLRLRIEAEDVTKEPRPRWGPRWAKMTREERLKDFQELLQRFSDAKSPGLPLEAISRDTIYD
jgi:hypothetical protein